MRVIIYDNDDQVINNITYEGVKPTKIIAELMGHDVRHSILNCIKEKEKVEQVLVEKGKKCAAGIMIYCTKTKRFLFPFRSNKVSDANKWGVWGGHVEHDENFQDAGVRELKEETGIVTDPDNLEDLCYNKNRDFEYCIFLLKVREEFEPDLNWETDHSTWLSFDHFPFKRLSLGLRRVYESVKCMDLFRKLSE